MVAHWLAGKRNFDGYRSYMPSMMDFPLTEAMRDALSHSGYFNDVYELMAQDYVYPHPEKLVLFDGNHDTARLFSVVNEDVGLWKIDLAYIMTMPRIPQFYYGTEIQMPSTVKGRDDSSYRRDFPGGWAGDAVDAFTGRGLTDAQREAQSWLRTMLNWRKGRSVIHDGRLMHFWPQDGTYAWVRFDARDATLVVINKNREPRTLPVARFREAIGARQRGRDVVTGQVHDLSTSVTIPARSVLVLDLE